MQLLVTGHESPVTHAGSETIDSEGRKVDRGLPPADKVSEETSAGSAAAETEVAVTKGVVDVSMPLRGAQHGK